MGGYIIYDWVLQTTSTSFRRMLRFWYRGNLVLNHQANKQREVLDNQDKVSNCAQCFFLEHCYYESIMFILLPLLLFLLHEAIFLDTHGIFGWPQTLKRNVGLLLWLPLPPLTTNDVSAISQMCLSFIHQWWQSAMTVHFWSQLGNEFPESDT